MAKENNHSKYPDAGRQPRQNSTFKRKEAQERQAEYDKLSVQEKLNKLDAKLGVGVGAKKQRAKLAAPKLEVKSVPQFTASTSTAAVQEVEAMNTIGKKHGLKAKDRRKHEKHNN